MADSIISKGPKDDTGFFAKNGTLQDLSEAFSGVQMAQSSNAINRLQGLGSLGALVYKLGNWLYGFL